MTPPYRTSRHFPVLGTSLNTRSVFPSDCFLTSSVWIIHHLNYHITPADHLFSVRMARGAGAASSPTTGTPPSGALKRSTSSTQNMKNQRSILGFFQKSSPLTPSGTRNADPASSPAERASEKREANSGKATSKSEKSVPRFTQNLTPVPSSDLVVPEEDEDKTQVC